MTLHVYLNLSIREETFDLARVTLKGQRSISPRSVDAVSALGMSSSCL